MEKTKQEILCESPLFQNLLPGELSMIVDLFVVRDFTIGETIFSEGDIGNSLFVIAMGEVAIVHIADDGRTIPLANLGESQFFGEMSLIDKEVRSANALASTNCQLLQLSVENLHSFAQHYRNGFTWMMVNIARVLSARLRDANRRLSTIG